MKVLMTADAVGGVWTYAYELSRALAAHDIDVVIAVMGPAPSPRQWLDAEALPNVRLDHAAFKLEWMDDPWSDVERAGGWLLALAVREQVDVVHLNGYAHAALPWPCPVVVVAHSCVCSWWQAVHAEPAPAQWDRYRESTAAGLAAADVVVAPTAAFLQTIEQIYGALPATRVIHNALPQPETEMLRQRDQVVLACGRAWDEAKNLRLLDGAMMSIDVPAYVAGDCTSPAGRRCAFASLRALGVLSAQDVHTWMSRAAVFAHPAVYEPFGLAVLEAAQRGCALVLSDVPTLRELWEGAAVFANPRDASAFATAIRTLFMQPKRRGELATAAVARAAEFQSHSMSDAYSSIYESLVRERQELAVA